MDENQNLLHTELHVDTIAAGHLRETARWAKFLGIVGLVVSILIGIVGLFAAPMITSMNKSFGSISPMNGLGTVFLTVLYLFIAFIYFFLSLFLFRFAVRLKSALQLNDQEQFNSALLNLKLIYRSLGIVMIIYLSLLALVMVAGIGTAIVAGR